MNLTRLLAPALVLAFAMIACSDGGGGGGGSATPCNNSSECPNGFECVANNTTNANPERPLSPGYTIQRVSNTEFVICFRHG